MKIAVIGAGWAGLAAAVQATQAGHQVTLFESARTPGGRARSVGVTGPDGTPLLLDNGQHILIGAYTDTLSLMRTVGVDPDAALLRLPLTLRFPDGTGIRCPHAPAPFDALAGILGAKGWQWRDKWSLLKASLGWQRAGFVCPPHVSVADLCSGLTARVRNEMIDPLCVSALNTPAAQASGQVFLRVLQDALFGVSGGSHLLLPRVDLGALFPDAALRWLAAHGAHTVLGKRVQSIQPQPDQTWRVDGEVFDQVVLACSPQEASRLVAGSGVGTAAAAQWVAQADALRFEAITTVYATSATVAQTPLAQPMLALRNTAALPAQFVFDRGQLGSPRGMLAFVISACEGDRAWLERQVCAQAAEQLGLQDVQPLQTVVEKRATFACTPGLVRPPMDVAPGLRVCGDYIEGPYPATLEGAVRSGQAAAT